MMLIFVVNSDCQCCVTVHFCVQYILGHDDRLRKPFESARPVIDVIFRSALHQRLYHGVIFIFRRSHEMEFDPRYPVHEYQSRAAVERQDVLRETCKGEIPYATESCSGHLGRSQLHHTREGPEQLLQFRTPMLYATGSNPWRL